VHVHIELHLGTLEKEKEKEREGLREGSKEAYATAGYAGLSMGAAVPHYCHWRAAAALCTDPSIIDVSDEEPPN
jgi:hypothetical protein